MMTLIEREVLGVLEIMVKTDLGALERVPVAPASWLGYSIPPMNATRSELLLSLDSVWQTFTRGALGLLTADEAPPALGGRPLPRPILEAVHAGRTVQGQADEGVYWWAVPMRGGPGRALVGWSADQGEFSSMLSRWVHLLEHEEAQRETSEELVRQLAHAWDRLSFLYQLTDIVRRSSELDAIFRAVVTLLGQIMAVEDVFISGIENGRATTISASNRSIPEINTLLGLVSASENPVRLADIPSQALGSDPWFATLTDLLLVRMNVDDKAFGLIGLANPSDGSFDSNDVQLIAAVAEQIAALVEVALARGRHEERLRLEHELSIASRLQTSLLPVSMPALPGLEMASYLRPASRVGGDFYDVAETQDGATMLLLADIAGKGVPAALLTSIVHAAFHGECARSTTPGELLARMNRLLYRDLDRSSAFVTAVVARVDSDPLGIQYASAGHVEPLVWRAKTGELSRLAVTGLPLGIEAESAYMSRGVPFATSDVILLYSDGVTEAEAADGKVLGVQGLSDILYATHPARASLQVEVIAEALDVHRASLPLRDDVALLMARALPASDVSNSVVPFVLQASRPSIRALVNIVREAGRALDMEGDSRTILVDEFALAVAEVFSNQIEHAYGGQGGRVQGRLIVFDRSIQADLFDSGSPFLQPPGPSQPRLDPSNPPERGFGLLLSNALTDECVYTRLEGGRNHWSLLKYAPSEGSYSR